MVKDQYAYTGKEWKVWPEAEKLVRDLLKEFLSVESVARNFALKLEMETSTTLFDWIDHIKVGGGVNKILELQKVGYNIEITPDEPKTVVMKHFNAQLPRIVVSYDKNHKDQVLAVAIKCDSLSTIRRHFSCKAPIQGTPYGNYATCIISQTKGHDFLAVERRGYQGMVPVGIDAMMLDSITTAKTIWTHRRRNFTDDAKGMKVTLDLAKKIIELVNPVMAIALAFEAEREYWTSRNKAAQVQKKRQDDFGLGWVNHDHHTFRSSREHFPMLIKIFEQFGFHCRERFYAGKEAGWGAQVLEQPKAGLVVFADVDLDPREVDIDFAHIELPRLSKLGTIGLWCGLHGEAILQAGMHHLEIQCSFDKFREDLPKKGVEVMKPFNDTKHIRQAFTVGERWQVDTRRLDMLLQKKMITEEQFDQFKKHGAIGSHLEHLWRGGGFKGFKKDGVNDIIKAVDPRKI